MKLNNHKRLIVNQKSFHYKISPAYASPKSWSSAPAEPAPKSTPAGSRLRFPGGARRARSAPRAPPPGPLSPLSGEPACTNRGVRRQGRAGTSSFPPSYTVATFRCETFQLLFPFRESLFLSPQRPRSPHGRPPQLSRPQRAVRVRARPRGRRIPALPPRPPLPLLYNLVGVQEAPPESEGGELGGGSSRVVETSDWEKSQPALVASFPLPVFLSYTPTPPPAPARDLAPSLARGPLPVALRVSARRGRPRGALALRVRVDGRRAGCGAWCPRSWAACPAR